MNNHIGYIEGNIEDNKSQNNSHINKDFNQEKIIKEESISISLEGTKNILFQMENCICKIYLKNYKIGIGFLCKIPFRNNLLPVLITNNHILNNIGNNEIIKLIINNEVKEIKLDKSRKKYISHDKNIDISILEIKPNKDKIYNYLEFDENDIFKKEGNFELEYKRELIYIIHYPNEKLSVSYGSINEIIDNKRFIHYFRIEEGSSCSPILSLKTFKVIGIHSNYSKNVKLNYGIIIKYVINDFNEYKNEINIIYKTDEEGEENIFGDKFVENNKNNIKLIINGDKNDLINRFNLRKGENNIKIIIKNKIIILY